MTGPLCRFPQLRVGFYWQAPADGDGHYGTAACWRKSVRVCGGRTSRGNTGLWPRRLQCSRPTSNEAVTGNHHTTLSWTITAHRLHHMLTVVTMATEDGTAGGGGDISGDAPVGRSGCCTCCWQWQNISNKTSRWKITRIKSSSAPTGF